MDNDRIFNLGIVAIMVVFAITIFWLYLKYNER